MAVVIGATLLGPSLSAPGLTGVVGGRAGYRQLTASWLCWRVRLRWYAVAFLFAPAVFLLILPGLLLLSPAFLPGIIVATRHAALSTGVIVGMLWGGWHLLTNAVWAGPSAAAEVPAGLFVAANALLMVVNQPPMFRVLMVRVNQRTDGLLVAVLMHASLLFSTFVLAPVGLTRVSTPIYPLAGGIGMWAAQASAYGFRTVNAHSPPPQRSGSTCMAEGVQHHAGTRSNDHRNTASQRQPGYRRAEGTRPSGQRSQSRDQTRW
jgi:hypothetical protein